MKKLAIALIAGTALVTATTATTGAQAEGELYIYNWTDYTPPELIEKFEAETGIDVTVDTYDSNETLLAKLKSGATGYDIAVPSQHFVKIMIMEDLLVPVGVHELENFKNVDKRWQFPVWDPKQEYSSPWHWGSASFAFNADKYSGKGESLKEFFEPNEEISGRLQVLKSPDEIVNLAHLYLGTPFCSENPEDMKKVQALLLGQKEHVLTYSSEAMNDRLASGDTLMAGQWNGDSMRGRLESLPSQRYAYPKEGIVGWFDSLVVPKGAKNVENAKIFMNFMMEPENAAMSSNAVRYSNGIAGSDPFMDDVMKDAPEINVPPDVQVVFGEACSPKAQKLVDRVWTRLLQ